MVHIEEREKRRGRRKRIRKRVGVMGLGAVAYA